MLKRREAVLIISLLTLLITVVSMFFLLQRLRAKEPLISPLAAPNSQAQNPPAYVLSNPSPLQATPSIIRVRKEVIGFLPSWIVAKTPTVNLSNFTQLIYFGLGVTEQGELIKFKEDGSAVLEWSYFNSPHFTQIRAEAKKKGVNVLIAIKNFDNVSIDTLISNQLATNKLTQEVITLIDSFDLAGVNIDFEYVTRTDFPTVRYFNRFWETLVINIKEKDPSLIVSLDVNATAVASDPAYDMVKAGELADQIILMAYDYHRVNSYEAGPVAPLQAGFLEPSITKSVLVLRGRVPAEKIILGIPFYGYEWQTINTSYKAPTVPNTGALATYGRVHDLLASRDDITLFWDERARSPWLVYRQSGAIKQIYYEDNRSIFEKIKFTNDNNLAGIAIWAVGYEGKYTKPWEVIKKYLN